MFHLIFGLPWLYVVTRTIWPRPWAVTFKLVVALILLIGSQFHLWSRPSSGSVFAPEFPRPAIILLDWLSGSIILMMVAQVAIDLITLGAAAAGIRSGNGAIDAR